jgi:hypothetical protein
MTRKRYSSEDKVGILREHLVTNAADRMFVKNTEFIPVNYTSGAKSCSKKR